MSTPTIATPSHYAASVAADEELPQHVRDDLASLKAAQDHLDATRDAAAAALRARNDNLKARWARVGYLGSRRIERETGIGESTIRAKTADLPTPTKPNGTK